MGKDALEQWEVERQRRRKETNSVGVEEYISVINCAKASAGEASILRSRSCSLALDLNS